jgi:CheY-like chemotaxis protein
LGYKILLADDSVTVQKIITLTFSDEGADVSTVNNGEEAITRLRYLRPDLVMADVSIPGKDGYDICEFVKTHPDLKGTPVILLVPAFEPYDEERARRVGADYHLTKPFQSIRTLISTVKNLIESSGRTGQTGQTGHTGQTWQTGQTGQMEQTAGLRDAARNQPAINSRISERGVFEAGDLRGPTDAHNEGQSKSIEGDWLGNGSEGDILHFSKGEDSRSSAGSSRRAAEERTSAARGVFDEDMDHVLELDDVLTELWSEPATQSVETGRRAPAAEASSVTTLVSAAEGGVQGMSLTLGQSSIDEIVNRVVANVMERLPALLSEQLANRLAGEVIEIIKRQQTAGKAADNESDSLLELDEI